MLSRLETRPDLAAGQFARLKKVVGAKSEKGMLGLDHDAESVCHSIFGKKFEAGDLQFLGEESLITFREWGPERYCVLADMIDGTDLLEMGVGLWCSAILIIDRERQLIIGSVVGLPSGHVFFAHEGEEGARVRVGISDAELSGCSDVRHLRDARICFYGQKIGRFLSQSVVDRLRLRVASPSEPESDSFRIYNFAGNPMMIKLVHRLKGDENSVLASGVDAVFEISGQQAHDVLPGAYIAKKAGAIMCDLAGADIAYSAMGAMATNPKARISYILSATPDLAKELVAVIAGAAKT